jgi:hypothetical protein
MQKGEDPQLIRDYLLSALDEQRQGEFEERLLADADLQAELSEAQHDLIDDYVFGLLSDRERALFEKNFAFNDERLHIVRLSEAMLKYTESNSEVADGHRNVFAGSGWRQSLRFLKEHKVAAACFVIVAAAAFYGLWTVYKHQQLKKHLAALQAHRLSVENELKRLNAGKIPESSTVMTITLRPLLRGPGETSQARVETNTDVIQLRLELIESNYASYRGIIENLEGAELYRVENLKTQPGSARMLLLNLPGQLTPVGSYQIHLIGVTPEGQEVDCCKYPFQIVNE